MKRTTKLLCLLSAEGLSVSLINHIIFYNAKKTEKIQIKEHTYKSKFGKINYTASGKGKPLLLIHGLGIGASHEEWNNSILFLSKYYRVYAIDLLGYGNSEKPNITYSAYLYIQLINEFISNVIKKSVYLIANANSASFAVMSCNFRPELYKKMILISPNGVGERKEIATNDDYWTKFIYDIPIVGTSIYNIMASKLSIKMFMHKYLYYNNSLVNLNSLNKYYYYSHIGGKNNKHSFKYFISKYLNINIEKQLKQIQIPIHIIWGEDNTINPVHNLDVIHKINPEITYSIFPHSKIMPHIEHLQAFHKIIKSFFN